MAGGKAGKDSGKSKQKAVSRSARAGLQFPVGRSVPFLQTLVPVLHTLVPVLHTLVHVLQYVSSCPSYVSSYTLVPVLHTVVPNSYPSYVKFLSFIR
jgi:hypothetical protein